MKIKNGPNCLDNTNESQKEELNAEKNPYSSREEIRCNDFDDQNSKWTPSKINNNILEIKLSNSKVPEPVATITKNDNIFNANSPSIFDLDV